jgi:hypothetical protein
MKAQGYLLLSREYLMPDDVAGIMKQEIRRSGIAAVHQHINERGTEQQWDPRSAPNIHASMKQIANLVARGWSEAKAVSYVLDGIAPDDDFWQ